MFSYSIVEFFTPYLQCADKAETENPCDGLLEDRRSVWAKTGSGADNKGAG